LSPKTDELNVNINIFVHSVLESIYCWMKSLVGQSRVGGFLQTSRLIMFGMQHALSIASTVSLSRLLHF